MDGWVYVSPGNKLFVSTITFKCSCILQCQHNMAFTMATREDLKMEVDEAAGCDVCHKVGVTCEVDMTSVTWWVSRVSHGEYNT